VHLAQSGPDHPYPRSPVPSSRALPMRGSGLGATQLRSPASAPSPRLLDAYARVFGSPGYPRAMGGSTPPRPGSVPPVLSSVPASLSGVRGRLSQGALPLSAPVSPVRPGSAGWDLRSPDRLTPVSAGYVSPLVALASRRMYE
jgi:hypothetical protein